MRFQGHPMQKRPIQYVSGHRNEALKVLRITAEEQTAFALYLNYAVNNLCEIGDIAATEEDKVHAALYSQQGRNGKRDFKRAFNALADFLWTFKSNTPEADEAGVKKAFKKSYHEQTEWLIRKIFTFRNFFTHVNEPSSDLLVVTPDDYRFLEGFLGGAARTAVMGKGLDASKVQKLKLVTAHNDKKTEYEFTREGLIFLVCLALYKDEAEEFCHQFSEMKVLESTDADQYTITLADGKKRRIMTKVERDEFKGDKPKGRALVDYFTYYSYRRGRQSLDAENLDFMAFTDILGCLNKVPAPAYDYLPLEEENKILKKLADESTESDANKRFKYALKRRDKNRFMSLAVAYCEDFDILPSLRFKRLDVRNIAGRAQYQFGTDCEEGGTPEENNRVRMNRHYVIHDDAVQFEFIPERHYGAIKIKSLRSAINSTELRKLLFLHVRGLSVGVDATFKNYFTAYHKMLERMVNAASMDEITFENYREEIATICGVSDPTLLFANPEKLKPYLTEGILRFFTKKSGKKDLDAQLDAIIAKINSKIGETYNTLIRLEKAADVRKERWDWNRKCENWRCKVSAFMKQNLGKNLSAELKNAEPIMPMDVKYPHCNIGERDGEVTRPPTSCKFNDSQLTWLVLDYLNFYLPASRKLRQLPVSEQHRGVEDHLFQMVHQSIGKFSLDQKGLWSLLEKFRPELEMQIAELKSRVNELVKSALRRSDGKRASATLEMLATAATEALNKKYNEELLAFNNGNFAQMLDKTDFDAMCRRYGIKLGLDVDRDSLLKVILGIDYSKWINAFDYSNERKYENRQLTNGEGHIVSQIPVPTSFALRAVNYKTKDNPSFTPFFECAVGFDFNKAFRAWQPEGKLQLRKFYDVEFLIDAIKNHKKEISISARCDGGVSLVYSRTLMNKLICEVKDYENKDKLLLAFAMKYFERFKKEETFSEAQKKTKKNLDDMQEGSIREFFDLPLTIETAEMKITIKPNDVNRPMYATIFGKSGSAKEYREALADIMSLRGFTEPYNFYDVVTVFREQKAHDRAERLKIMPALANFESRVTIPPEKYSKIEAEIQKDTPNRSSVVSEAKRKMEFEEYYKKVFPGLTREKYETLVNVRNAVFHDGFCLNVEPALNIMRNCGKDKPKRQQWNNRPRPSRW